MKISYKCDYALKIILDLSNYYPDTLVHIEDIANRQDIPVKFLEQILLDLKKGGFVQSKKGPKGGYSLTRDPEYIKIGDIVRHIEGPVHPISCIDDNVPQTCNEVDKCAFMPVWREVSDAISHIIDNITFKDIKERQDALRESESITYYI